MASVVCLDYIRYRLCNQPGECSGQAVEGLTAE